MSYRGISPWPPQWLWRCGESLKEVRGEIGILKKVIPSAMSPRDRIFLIIEHEVNEYMGCLMISDRAFRRQILNLLQAHCGNTLEQIGGLDLSHLL